jgi:hypothetical protein
MTKKTLESRLAVLEKKLAEMEQQLQSLAGKKDHPNPQGAWWVTTAGRFKDDPVFDEIVRLGREYRESLHPDRIKQKSSKRKK